MNISWEIRLTISNKTAKNDLSNEKKDIEYNAKVLLFTNEWKDILRKKREIWLKKPVGYKT